MQRQCRRRQDADCCFGPVLEAADDYWNINFSEESAALPSVGALLTMVHLPKNRRSPGTPQPPQRQDGQDVLLPAETTKKNLAQTWPENQPRGEQPTAELETEQGHSKVPGTEPSPRWRSHQMGVCRLWRHQSSEQQLLPQHTAGTASCCWCFGEFPPLSTPVMPFACFPERLRTFCVMISL